MSKAIERSSSRPYVGNARITRMVGRSRLLVWAGILASVLCFPWTGDAQISPGPLARAHQNLNGGSNCIKCHEVSTKAPTFKCMECHKEIAAEVQGNHGLHSTYPRTGPTGAFCVKCHSDHNGLDFNMIHW